MIYKFIGGPLDGREKEIPSESVEKFKYVVIPWHDSYEFVALTYEHGEIGDLIFVEPWQL